MPQATNPAAILNPLLAKTLPSHIILVGPPGVGKGTQGMMLAKELGIPHVATGDLIREEVASGSKAGLRFKALIDDGNFISDVDVVQIVAEHLLSDVAKTGYLLDGFPRSVDQATLFATTDAGKLLDCTIILTIDEDVLVERLSGRLTCLHCGASFQIDHCPPKVAGVCDVCGSPLIKRGDDEPDAIRHRLSVYHAKTQPLVEFYREAGKQVEVDASGAPEEVFARVLHLLSQE